MTAASENTEDEPRSGDSTGQAIAGLPGSYARWRQSTLGGITDAIEAELILDLLAPLAGLRVLDVGCGDGALAAEISRHGAVVTGLNPDPPCWLARSMSRHRAPWPATVATSDELHRSTDTISKPDGMANIYRPAAGWCRHRLHAVSKFSRRGEVWNYSTLPAI